MTPATRDRLPNFARPPLIEVVSGVLFRQIDALLIPHLGLLWSEKYRDEYPTFREVDPLVPVIERLGDPAAEERSVFEFAPLPRVWFVEESENAIVQVQRDRFHHNWKKVRSDDEYPRYGRVIDLFFDRFHRFEAFLREHELPGVEPRQCELTYINHIPQGEGWDSLTDVGRVFPDFSWRADVRRAIPSPSSVNWTTAFDFPQKEGRLRVTIAHAISRADKRPLLTLELTARGFGGDKSPEGMRRWFDLAHKYIVNAFVEMTSREVRERVWREGQ
jgi:uncharacterized protein (TIGR04255 family)